MPKGPQELLTLAKEVVQAEKQVDPVDEQAKVKAALTELFAEVKNGKTPMVIERIVTEYLRYRAAGPVPRLAKHQSLRARGPESPAQSDLREVPGQGPGSVR